MFVCCFLLYTNTRGIFTCCCSWVRRVLQAPVSGRSSAIWAGAQAHPVLDRWRWRCGRQAGWWTVGGEQTLQELKKERNKRLDHLAILTLTKRKKNKVLSRIQRCEWCPESKQTKNKDTEIKKNETENKERWFRWFCNFLLRIQKK